MNQQQRSHALSTPENRQAGIFGDSLFCKGMHVLLELYEIQLGSPPMGDGIISLPSEVQGKSHKACISHRIGQPMKIRRRSIHAMQIN